MARRLTGSPESGNERLDQWDVATALGLVYERFGGAHAFAAAFMTQYEQAPPGSYRRTRMLEAIAYLTQLDSARQDAVKAARDAETSLMTDEELEQERTALVTDLLPSILAAQPQIAVSVLEQFGYTVIPPVAAKSP